MIHRLQAKCRVKPLLKRRCSHRRNPPRANFLRKIQPKRRLTIIYCRRKQMESPVNQRKNSPKRILETVESETESDGETLTFGRILNETTIEVYTYDELKQALSGDNGYTTIYLGDNITADGTGIDIHPNKTDVIIDGAPPEGGRYRFTQYVSANDSTSIRVRSAGIQSVTLRNLDIHGANYYGVVWVPDSISGIVIIHENVDYTGPQPVYNRSGTTRLADSTYTLRPVSGMSGEIAETMHAEFSGTIHISAAGTNHPVLQLTSSVSTLTVLDGAEVTVNTDYGFLGTKRPDPRRHAVLRLCLPSYQQPLWIYCR